MRLEPHTFNGLLILAQLTRLHKGKEEENKKERVQNYTCGVSDKLNPKGKQG